MNMKRVGMVLLVGVATLMSACQSKPVAEPAAPAERPEVAETPKAVEADPNVRTYFVAPEMADGVGVGPMTCLRVKRERDAKYGMFYSRIKGFDYVPGYEYELRVRVTERDRVPADASKYIYTLVEVVSKKPAGLALEGTTWRLVDRVADSDVSVRFEKGKVTGNGGVNRFFGGYEVDGAKLTIGNLGASMMAGPQDLMDQETALQAALGKTRRYLIVDGQLRLVDENSRVLAALAKESD